MRHSTPAAIYVLLALLTGGLIAYIFMPVKQPGMPTPSKAAAAGPKAATAGPNKGATDKPPVQRSSTPAAGPASGSFSRETRRQRIAAFIREQRILSQFDLQDLLAEEGIVVNQGTLSRDLRAMGVLKGRDGYELPSDIPAEQVDRSVELYHAVHAWLAAAITAENQVVLRTPAGGANPLALALDHADWKEVLGTIAGDDTVLVVCKTPGEARRVAKALLELKESRKK